MTFPARKSFGYISSPLYLGHNIVLITQPAQIYKTNEQNLPHTWEVHCHSLFFLRALQDVGSRKFVRTGALNI